MKLTLSYTWENRGKSINLKHTIFFLNNLSNNQFGFKKNLAVKEL